MDWCAGGEDLLGDPTLLVAAGMLHGPAQFCTDTCCTPGLEQPSDEQQHAAAAAAAVQYQQPAIVTVGGSYGYVCAFAVAFTPAAFSAADPICFAVHFSRPGVNFVGETENGRVEGGEMLKSLCIDTPF